MFHKIDDIEIFYENLGTGHPIMFMHGGMGFDHTCFRPWLDPLAADHELIYYDHRGNGSSTRIDDFTGFDPMSWVEDAEALRKHLGHEKIILMAHSAAGGFVAIDYALRQGNHLAGLILCCASPVLDYAEEMMSNARSRATDVQFNAMLKAFTEQYNDLTFMELLSEYLPLYFNNFNVSTGEKILSRIQLRAAAANYSAASWFPFCNYLDRLHDIKVPTLILTGREDWVTPPRQGAERLHEGIPNSELVIFEESGHMPFIEEQERFIGLVRDWAVGLF